MLACMPSHTLVEVGDGRGYVYNHETVPVIIMRTIINWWLGFTSAIGISHLAA